MSSEGQEFDIFPQYLLGISGVLLIISGLFVLYGIQESSLLTVIIALGPGLTLLLGEYWIHRSSLPPERYRSVVLWVVIGAGGLVIVPIAINLSPNLRIDFPILSIQAGLGFGAVGGLMAGYFAARSTEGALRAERVRMQAEQVNRDRDRLQHLNHLLRHDIINNVTVIRGYAELLIEECEQEEGKKIETIQQQAEATIELIENVRTYLEAVSEGDETLKAIDLSESLADEVKHIESRYPDVDIETDLISGVSVMADDLLQSIFTNLLNNAVVHNDAPTPEIRISMKATDNQAIVFIADNGPGIPQDVQESLFQPSESGDHGFGLYLVKTLVDRYGGSISYERTEDSGTTFEMQFPLAQPSHS